MGGLCPERKRHKDMRTMNRFDYLNIERFDNALLSMPSRKGSVLVHSLEIGQVRENCLYNYRHR